MARIKSLKELGKGKWKVASISPIISNTVKAKLSETTPQEILFQAVHEKWPEAVPEYPPGIPGRRFRIDIALVKEKLGMELDGWQFHGRHLEDFKRDRARQNLLVVHGWKILRFTASDVHNDLAGCISMIDRALASS